MMVSVETIILELHDTHLRAIVNTTAHQSKWGHLLKLLTLYRQWEMGQDYKWSHFPRECLAALKYCGNAGRRNAAEDLACEVDVAEYIQSNFR